MKRTVVIFGVVPIAVVALVGCKTANKTDETTTTTSTIPILEQPAVWPSSDKKFDTPEAVADDFVRYALRAEPNLGEFMAGDSLSGEIDVLVPGSNVVRGTLLLRKLGSPQSWFVIGAVSDHASITSPAPQTEIPSGVLQELGMGGASKHNCISPQLIHSNPPR